MCRVARVRRIEVAKYGIDAEAHLGFEHNVLHSKKGPAILPRTRTSFLLLELL